ncbi:hypothetical protein L208DRAFT_1382214 [Tricholoma matsutake]|nr:hypothetical protein L208DRAFT_1382214 [Tricholoma matsutake 945]
MEVSPFALEVFHPKLEVLETVQELGITIIADSPLSHGLMTGQYKSMDDFGGHDFRFSKENFPQILGLISQIKGIAMCHNATPGQAILAWLLAQGNNFGTKKIIFGKDYLGEAALPLDDWFTSPSPDEKDRVYAFDAGNMVFSVPLLSMCANMPLMGTTEGVGTICSSHTCADALAFQDDGLSESEASEDRDSDYKEAEDEDTFPALPNPHPIPPSGSAAEFQKPLSPLINSVHYFPSISTMHET